MKKADNSPKKCYIRVGSYNEIYSIGTGKVDLLFFIPIQMRLVLLVKSKIDAKSLMGTQIIDLSRSDNMIGACPVFDNYDRAVEYAGDKNLVTQVSIVE